MKVKELIATLQQEDPEAVIVVIPKRHQLRTLSRLRYEHTQPPIYDVEFGGNERETTPKVVLLTSREDQ